MDVFSAPHFQNDDAARKMLESNPVAGRPGLPALRRREPRLRYEASGRVPVR